MPTPRSPAVDKRSAERKEAERMFLESKGDVKLVEIAEKLKLPANKIRKWKTLDDWETKLHPDSKNSKKKQVERSTSTKGSAPPKHGGQQGNQNAKGGKGNPHPEKPIKHGGYVPVFMDALAAAVPTDTEQQLMEQIQLFSIRERRILKAINKYRETNSEVAVSSINRFEEKRAFKSKEDEAEYDRRQKEKVDSGSILPGKTYTMSTHTANKDMIIARLEQELSTVQGKKTKAIEALLKYRLEKEKLESESSGSAAVDDWISAVLGEDVTDDEQ